MIDDSKGFDGRSYVDVFRALNEIFFQVDPMLVHITAIMQNIADSSQPQRKMGKKGDPSEEREGNKLLGKPKFKKLENGRFKCVETGHEVPNQEAKASYSQTKHCRIGLIDSALSKNKPPLNIFKQDPACRTCQAAIAKKNPPLNIFRQEPSSRLKLICQLTGDTINKSEEHIWKHINGKRFLNMLEKKEAEKETGGEAIEGEGQSPDSKKKEDHVKEKKKKEKMKKKKKKNKKKGEEEKKKEEDNDNGKDNSEVMISSDKECDSENGDFWMPPAGERWDMDDGGDRWGSGSDSGSDSDAELAELEHVDDVANGADDAVDDESIGESGELSTRTKRMSIEIGPSSSASRKKKKKKTEAQE